MVILSQEFNGILDEFGHDVLLIKNRRDKECNCVDTITRSAKDTCPICLGTGYIHDSKIIKIRNVTKYSLENYKFQNIGNSVINQNNIYIKAIDRPEQDDLIVQLSFDKNNKPYIDEYSNIFLIDNVAPLREERGAIAFFICSTEAQPINKSHRLTTIVNEYGTQENIYKYVRCNGEEINFSSRDW